MAADWRGLYESRLSAAVWAEGQGNVCVSVCLTLGLPMTQTEASAAREGWRSPHEFLGLCRRGRWGQRFASVELKVVNGGVGDRL